VDHVDDSTKDHALPMVRFPGRRSGEILRLRLQEFQDRKISRYGKEGFEIHGRTAGTVMTVEFEIDGQKFVALNGGPHFRFNEAVSFQIHCDTQQEIDYFWSKLGEGGQEQPCGWLKDKFGLSWQVIPKALPEMLMDENSDKAQRVMRSMLQMRKIDLAALERAQAA
jgi:predicted 3-demethylubiquinone-9 3-methyltransferase (glyoxalase superfamily)